MNKKIKNIMKIALTISILSSTQLTNYNFGITKAYADSSDIYLDSLSVSNVNFSFSAQRTVYDVNVSPEVMEATIRAKPEFEDSTVEIDGTVVTYKDKYKKVVQLKEDKNTFKINVQDDDNLRTYTLNITKEAQKTSDNNTSNSNTTNTSNSSANLKYNQWINENGIWKYNDIAGNSVKDTWFFDKNYVQSYYLKADGSMAVGWLLNNGQWYYLDGSGAKQIGWKLIGEKWYYFNEGGIMQKDTMIGNFKLGSNGEWIKNY